jgi:hypothetical protein
MKTKKRTLKKQVRLSQEELIQRIKIMQQGGRIE